jgi:hypothetical protein
MTAVAPIAEKRVDPLEAYIERARARALLWAESEIDTIPAAVDPLQEFAERCGLVAEIGQDAVQKILGLAFAPYRKNELKPTDHEEVQHCSDEIGMRKSIPQSTIDAFRYVVKQNNPEQLRSWLARRRPDELAVFKTMLAPK